MTIKCPICSNKILPLVSSWTFLCKKCNYWGANLIPQVSETNHSVFNDLQEGKNAVSYLDLIREENFNKILSYIDKESINAKSILDIGCASGLFLEMACQHGYEVYGVEPNPVMYEVAKKKQLNVVNGYFPENLILSIKYDIIIFNDVLEHIPDINETILACKNFLKENGLLIINIPNSSGILFKVAKILGHLKIYGPWKRLWQEMFHTPHLHYFNSSSLEMLVNNNGLITNMKENRLESFQLKGLWERISTDKSMGLLTSIFIYCCFVALYPVIKIMPSDSFFAVYKK